MNKMTNQGFSDFRAYIELLRPPLAPMDIAMPAASALLAVYAVEGTLPPLIPFVIAVLGSYCAITSSYVYNDCCDIEVDKVGMPCRPLPSAKLNKRQAQSWSIFLFLVALSAALYLNPESFVALVAATILASIYSAWAKRNTPFSWIFVGLSYGLVPLGVWLAMEPAGILKAGAGIHPASLILAAMICITDWGFTNCDAYVMLRATEEREFPPHPPPSALRSPQRWGPSSGWQESLFPLPWDWPRAWDGSISSQPLYPAAGCWGKTLISCAIQRQKEASSSSISPPTTVRGSLRL